MNKKCCKCKEIKHLDSFHRSSKSRDNRTRHCKDCQSKADKKRKAVYLKDPYYKLMDDLRASVRNAIRNGYTERSKAYKLLGCDYQSFKEHIESKFEEGMSWENYGRTTWHIDHIIPISKFDLMDEKQKFECFNYKNTQPLRARDNYVKGTKRDSLWGNMEVRDDSLDELFEDYKDKEDE